jgi:hypothetical protein
MQLLRVFSIIIALVLIIASSSNISFKSGNDVNPGINTKAPLIDSILLSIDDKSTFSSLLQTISAQEQEQQEVDQEEDGKDSDPVMEREEEQDRGDSERESSIGQEQEQEQQDSEKEQEQDKIKEDCGPTEHFDSEVDSCIPDEEKVCDDDRDNDNDGKVDSEDSDCLPNKNEQEQQQSNKEEQEDKEKLPGGGEELSLDNEKDNNYRENPVSIEEQNNSTSSDGHNTEDKAQNSNQNLTDSNSTAATTTSNNNASLDGFDPYANTSAAEEDSFTLKCHPEGAEMVPGAEDSITCTVENKAPKPIELVLECSGLEGTGIECSINGDYPTGRTLVKEMSDTNFSVLVVSRSSPPVPAGSYPFTISAELCINSDLC